MDTMASAYLERTAWTRASPRGRALARRAAPGRPRARPRLRRGRDLALPLRPSAARRSASTPSRWRSRRHARSSPTCSFQLANVVRLPFEDGSFDKAVAADLVEHLDDETFRAMLVETRRVLRPGGTLSLYTPNPRHPIERLKARDLILAQNPTHIGLRDAKTLEAMLREGGFEVDRSEWRPSFIRGLRLVERGGGGRIESLRYRLCVRGEAVERVAGVAVEPRQREPGRVPVAGRGRRTARRSAAGSRGRPWRGTCLRRHVARSAGSASCPRRARAARR